MPIIGKRKKRAAQDSRFMGDLQQHVENVGSTDSQPTLMPIGSIPPSAPPLIVRPSSSISSTAESASGTAINARCKPKSTTDPPHKKKRGFCSEKKTEKIRVATGKNIQLDYDPKTKGPSMRGVNNMVVKEIGGAIQSHRLEQVDVLDKVLKIQKGKEIRGMRRADMRASSQSSISTLRTRAPSNDERVREITEHYKKKIREAEERVEQAEQQIERVELQMKMIKQQMAVVFSTLGWQPPPQCQAP